jgi:hypothetical protein
MRLTGVGIDRIVIGSTVRRLPASAVPGRRRTVIGLDIYVRFNGARSGERPAGQLVVKPRAHR